MNLQRLRAFHAVMATGSVTKAATVLGLSQPAVSRLLLVLEQELGFRLFLRHKSGLLPTAEGRQFHRRAGRVLTGIEEISSIARDVREYRHGHLRLVAMPQLASTLFPAAIAAFQAEHPEAKTTLEVIPRRDVEHWVAALEFDVGITALPVEWPLIDVEPFISVPAVAIVPLDHAYAARSSLCAADLQGQPFIRLTQHNLLRHQVDAQLTEQNVLTEVRVETSSPIATCQLVSQGLGISIVDAFSPLTSDTHRIAVLRWSPPLSLTYGWLYPSGQPVPVLARRFEEIFLRVMKRTLSRLRLPASEVKGGRPGRAPAA